MPNDDDSSLYSFNGTVYGWASDTILCHVMIAPAWAIGMDITTFIDDSPYFIS